MCFLFHYLYDNIKAVDGASGYQSNMLLQHTPVDGKWSLVYTVLATNPHAVDGDELAQSPSISYVGKQGYIHLSILKCLIRPCVRLGLSFFQHLMDKWNYVH